MSLGIPFSLNPEDVEVYFDADGQQTVPNGKYWMVVVQLFPQDETGISYVNGTDPIPETGSQFLLDSEVALNCKNQYSETITNGVSGSGINLLKTANGRSGTLYSSGRAITPASSTAFKQQTQISTNGVDATAFTLYFEYDSPDRNPQVGTFILKEGQTAEINGNGSMTVHQYVVGT